MRATLNRGSAGLTSVTADVPARWWTAGPAVSPFRGYGRGWNATHRSISTITIRGLKEQNWKGPISFASTGIASVNYRVLFGLVFNMVAAPCFAEGAEWRRYQIPSTGAKCWYSRFPLHRGCGLARRRNRAALLYKRPSGRSDNPIGPNPGERIAGWISAEEATAFRHSIQACDAAFLRSVQHSKRQNLVQPL